MLILGGFTESTNSAFGWPDQETYRLEETREKESLLS